MKAQVLAERRDELTELLQELVGENVEEVEQRSRAGTINGDLVVSARSGSTHIIEWMVSSFAKLKLRDNCLIAAVTLLDRLGAARNGRPAMNPRSAWIEALAASLIAMKEAGVEAEIEDDEGSPSVLDLVMHLKNISGLKSERMRGNVWDAIRMAEIHILTQLDFRVSVPTSVDLVQEFSLQLQRKAPKSWAGGKILLARTPGYKLGHAPEPRPVFALLAELLLEISVVHAPHRVYRSDAPPAAAALAALSLAMQAFGEAPAESVAALHHMEQTLLSKQEAELLPSMRDDMVQARLSACSSGDSPVWRVWQERPGYMDFMRAKLPQGDAWKQRVASVVPAAVPLKLQDCKDPETPRSFQDELDTCTPAGSLSSTGTQGSSSSWNSLAPSSVNKEDSSGDGPDNCCRRLFTEGEASSAVESETPLKKVVGAGAVRMETSTGAKISKDRDVEMMEPSDEMMLPPANVPVGLPLSVDAALDETMPRTPQQKKTAALAVAEPREAASPRVADVQQPTSEAASGAPAAWDLPMASRAPLMPVGHIANLVTPAHHLEQQQQQCNKAAAKPKGMRKACKPFGGGRISSKNATAPRNTRQSNALGTAHVRSARLQELQENAQEVDRLLEQPCKQRVPAPQQHPQERLKSNSNAPASARRETRAGGCSSNTAATDYNLSKRHNTRAKAHAVKAELEEYEKLLERGEIKIPKDLESFYQLQLRDSRLGFQQCMGMSRENFNLSRLDLFKRVDVTQNKRKAPSASGPPPPQSWSAESKTCGSSTAKRRRTINLK
mmetsp:Transcript_3138/g.7072  ORF Transcript_3138/g.7072 Transcript_3138/m.7072 type:complete len:783 (-) Transcript_3138:306-2654(-)